MGLALIFFFLLLPFEAVCFAEPPSASQIGRGQEILQKEEILRNKLEKEEKVFIKKIIVTGITLLDEDKIKEAISPFQAHWLTNKDIQQILELLKEAYRQQGYPGLHASISYQIKRKNLLIKVEEKLADYK